MIAAPKPNVAKKIATMEDENVRFRNRWSGMIGSGARLSTITKTTRKASPITIEPHTKGSAQLPFSATVKPIRIGTSPAMSVTTPR